jgi:hypothetical protein
MAEIPDEPRGSASDVAYGVVKAAVSAVPVVGGSAAEFLALIFGPPLERRQHEWLQRLASAVGELQEKVEGLTPEKLSENQAFVTMAMRASEIAIRTHDGEKLGALRNAVVNGLLPGSPEDMVQQIFLNYVEVFTVWHLRLLTFFSDPADWGRTHHIAYPNWTMGSPVTVLEYAMPELGGRQPFYDQIVGDLVQRGLMLGGGLRTTMTASGMLSPRTTDLGNQFLHFISAR